MKTTPVCFIFTSLLACAPLAFAQKPVDGPMGDERQAPGDGWKKFDQDGDGSISRAEFSQMPRLSKLADDKRQALFDRLDKNGDGSISRPELYVGSPDSDHRHPGPPRLKELDKNSDGVISFEEFQASPMFQRLDPERQKRIFSRLDSNGDGKITPEDRPQMRPRPEGGERPRPEGMDRPRPEGGEGPKPERPHPRGLIDHLDKDGDGIVTLEEFRKNPRMAELDDETVRQRYRMLDRNKDGKVDRDDIPRRDGPGPGPRPDAPERPERPQNVE